MVLKKVFMFSGQGSQYKGMGQKLYKENGNFRENVLALDRKARDHIGESVIELLYGDDQAKLFERLVYTNSAIFMVEYALAQTLIASGIEPDGVVGTSMGEFASAVIADVLTVDEAFITLIEMSRLTETHCHTGGMLAIFHNARLFEESPELYEYSELASLNYDSHFVVASTINHLQRIEHFLHKNNILYQRVPVSYAFHSTHLDPMTETYLAYLKNLNYGQPSIPMFSSVTGQQISHIDTSYFKDVVREPIQFHKALQYIEQQEPRVFIDLGPSGTLAGFAKHILTPHSPSKVYSIMTPFHTEINYLNKLIVEVSERTSEKMLAYLFPGQGAQKKGMGAELFDEFPELTAKADDILGYSIKQLCVDDPHRQLGQTQFTQPALYVVNAFNYLKKIKETGRKPDVVAGHSLGEYNALFVSGAFDFETGLRLVKKRGELMSRVTGSGMAAVIGFTEEKIKKILLENDLHSIDIANYNTPSQIVIAGLRDDIERAQPIFEAAGVNMYLILRVSGAFHSRHMKEVEMEFANYLNQFDFQNLQIPVISNVTARPYSQHDDPKQLLTEQITSSVQWNNSVRYLLAKGDIDLVEIGVSTVITRMVEQIKKEAEPLSIAEISSVVEEDSSVHHPLREKPTVHSPEPTSHDPAQLLGDKSFKQDYQVNYAYVAGAMYKGIASKELVLKMSKAGMLSFYGTGGLSLERIEEDIQHIQHHLKDGDPYGMNLVHDPTDLSIEEKTVNLFLRYGIRHIEASAFMGITPALILYRAKGLFRKHDGSVGSDYTIMAKVSRPDVAQAFLSPAPDHIVTKLVEEGKLTIEESDMLREIPMADDICAESDSGGHTDHAVAFALLPAVINLRNEMMQTYAYDKRVRVGAAGGIGTPEAVASAFIMGADFVLTGSVNQCTQEAGTSDVVKDLLSQMNVHDTDSVPAGDMFEIGAKVQVLKRGVFFPARAKKLYELYRQHQSLDEIKEKLKEQIQHRYFKRTFDDVYEEVKSYHPPEEIEKADKNSKHKMALVFRWYFGYSTRLAMEGNTRYKVDFQVHTGPALGAFNQWVKGTDLENWRNRHVDDIGRKLMEGAVQVLTQRLEELPIKEKVMV